MDIPASKYLEATLSAKEAHEGSYYLVGSTFLVEYLPDDVKEKEVKKADGSSIKLVTGTGTELNSNWRNTTGLDIPFWGRVLDVGTDISHPDWEGLPLRPGQIIQMPRSAVQWFRNWGSAERYELNTIGIANVDSVRIVFQDDDAYRSYYRKFDENVQN